MVPRHVRRYLGLPRAERWLVARAFVALARVDLALRAAGFRRLVRRVERRSARPGHVGGTATLERASRYARAIEIAARHHVVRARCLHRALVLHTWLRRDGLPSVLCIGVRKARGQLQAHAWVELEGQLVYEPPALVADFARLAPSTRGAGQQAADDDPVGWLAGLHPGRTEWVER